jgi:hypothetical protein
MGEHTFVPKDPVPALEPLLQRTGRPPLEDGRDELRDCRAHGLVPHRQFRDGRTLRWRCRRCVGEAVSRRHRKIKETLVAAAGGACVVCGYARCLVNLHFHHVDPSTKLLGVSVSSGKSMAKHLAEARKCILVCANCHGEIETGLVRCPPLTACWPEEDGEAA